MQYEENDIKNPVHVHSLLLYHSRGLTHFEVNQLIFPHSQTNYPNLLQFHKQLQFLQD